METTSSINGTINNTVEIEWFDDYEDVVEEDINSKGRKKKQKISKHHLQNISLKEKLIQQCTDIGLDYKNIDEWESEKWDKFMEEYYPATKDFNIKDFRKSMVHFVKMKIK